jgi:hypothetical protein
MTPRTWKEHRVARARNDQERRERVIFFAVALVLFALLLCGMAVVNKHLPDQLIARQAMVEANHASH